MPLVSLFSLFYCVHLNFMPVLYQNYSDEEDYSRIVTLQEIRDKEYNLSPNRYVVYHKEEIRPYAEVLAEFKQAYEDVKRLENEFSLLINA